MTRRTTVHTRWISSLRDRSRSVCKPNSCGRGGPVEGYFICRVHRANSKSELHWNATCWQFHLLHFKVPRVAREYFTMTNVRLQSWSGNIRRWVWNAEVINPSKWIVSRIPCRLKVDINESRCSSEWRQFKCESWLPDYSSSAEFVMTSIWSNKNKGRGRRPVHQLERVQGPGWVDYDL